jgi:uncharacterized membrane protein
VIAFANEETAKQAGAKLLSMERENLITVEDAVIAVKTTDGGIKLGQFANSGEFWGIRAAASGYPAADVAGALTDFGKADKFVTGIAGGLPPSAAALFVLVRKMTTDEVLGGLKSVGGTVLHTSFDKSAVEAIRAVLATQLARAGAG